MKLRTRRRDGFTLIEVMIAGLLCVIVLGCISMAVGQFRRAIVFSGVAQIQDEGVAIAANDVEGGLARRLITEAIALGTQSEFSFVTEGVVDSASAVSQTNLAFLHGVDPATLKDLVAAKNLMAGNGIVYTAEAGYTLWFIGPRLEPLGALTVESHIATATNGDPFRVYAIRLYSDGPDGLDENHGYRFALEANAQSTMPPLPVYAASGWEINLPDPMISPLSHDGTVLNINVHTLSIAARAGF